MTEPTKPDEGKQAPEGEVESSTSPASPDAAQLLAGKVEAMAKQLEEMGKTIKGVQKGADKRIDSLERVLELAKSGMSKSQIERELFLDQMMQGKEGADTEPASDTAGEGNSPDFSKVIDEVLALPANDARVTDLKLKHASDPVGYLREALALAARMAEQKESSPAEQPLPKGGPVQHDENSIANIDDPKTLYRLAREQMNSGQKKRRG